MRLIITEKPSVARDIAAVLGAKSKRQGYIEGKNVRIAWCFGHMATLAEPAAYDSSWKRWSMSALPMIPETFKLVGISSSKDQLKVLKSQINSSDITEVVNACDAGREGELIFRYVYELCHGRKPVQRLWLSSMTTAAIKAAFSALEPGAKFDALGDAARCRSEADWLIGMNATRALTLRCRQLGGGDVMSVGRVQTPTLAMIVEREIEIEAFTPESFWQVYATFGAGEQEDESIESSYEGVWTHKKQERTFKKEEAEAIMDAIDGQPAKVAKVQHKDVKTRPPHLFDLTSLQREANKRFGFSAKQTLDIAQSLYETHKLITYPRTDSNYLTSDMKAGLPKILAAIKIPTYEGFCDKLLDNLPLKINKRIVDDKEVGDHHAIIPTDRTPDASRLSAQEKKIYDLIARRFIGAFFPDAIFATTKIATAVASHMFLTTGKVRKVAGWQEVDPPPKFKGKGKKPEPILPSVAKGDVVELEKQRLHEGQTQAPRRYNENGLLGAMERAGSQLDDDMMRRAMKESGLGTPATRAATIELLLRRDFIERQGKNLVPTQKGRGLILSIPIDDLKSAALTGEWESKLTRVADGRLARANFMEEVNKLTARLTGQLRDQEMDLPEGALQKTERDVLGTCPICQKDVFETPKAYTCATGRDCSFVIFKTVARRKVSPSLVKLLLSGKTSKPLKGFKSKKKTSFEACLKLDEEGKVAFVFDREGSSSTQPPSTRSSSSPKARARKLEPADKPVRALLTCPSCEQGHIIRGKRGWGCSRWRTGCKFVVWYEHDGVRITDDEGRALFEEGATPPIAALGGVRLILDLEAEHNIRPAS